MDTPPKRGAFLDQHPVLTWALCLAILLLVVSLRYWLDDILHSGGPKSYVAGGVLALVFIQDFVSLYRRDWSQRPMARDLAVQRAWGYLAIAFVSFVIGLLSLFSPRIEERIVGGAVSLVIGVGYFWLRALERRKGPLHPSPFFWF